jgi:hypothetical protein
MRVNFSFVAAIFVALLMSGTVGCVNTGGPWYSPNSYSLANPFSKKDGQAPPYPSRALANDKPNLGAQPNVDTPRGGYTETNETYSSRLGSSNSAATHSPSEHWNQQNTIVSQNSPGPYGGYTVPEPSQYSPSYTDAQGTASSPYQYSPNPSYQYSPEIIQQTNNSLPYGNDYAPGGYPSANTPGAHQPTANHVPANNYGINQPTGAYPTLGGMPQNEALAGLPQQGTVQPAGFNMYDQQTPANPYPANSYSGDGIPTASQNQPSSPYYQPYQPPTAGGGFNYNY